MLCKKKVILQDIFIKANYKRYLMEDSHNKEIETNNPIEQPAKELTSESEENYIQKVQIDKNLQFVKKVQIS